ncbi:MAG: aminodeoxychorismate synthase component I [Gammaproteobacteria bacterium]|nr:aminodeoxychorismate synthase component I [Gammaproteobacteria bacterium]
MSDILIKTLPYQADPLPLFSHLKSRSWAQLLDSGNCNTELARYDLMVADPRLKIISQKGTTRITDNGGKITETLENTFELVKTILADISCNDRSLPFCGGALGYFGYDLASESSASEPVTTDQRPVMIDLPDMAIGIYDWAVITDHFEKKTLLVTCSEQKEALEELEQLYSELSGHVNSITSREAVPALQVSQLDVDIDYTHYKNGFNHIQNYLKDGDCYQINYARCYSSSCQGSAWESYKLLRHNNPVPFGAYLDFPFGQILSASPERFIKVSGNHVETRPIKGTRPRGLTEKEDNKLKADLSNSEKDRAENLMIVDLLRNDLGKTCDPGTIEVPELFKTETFPTVFHLVSTVTGKIKNGLSALDVLRHCFPGGSITGAPKKRAMEIIQELEKHQRDIYCGAIGYISFNGNMDTNIAIRTMTVADKQLCFWAGGGIVADSEVENEFQETRDKAAAFCQLLNIQDIP